MKISRFLLTGLLLLTTVLAFGQSKTITGTVTSAADGDALPGATVIKQGTTDGTVTDVNGKFSLQTQVGQTLVVSFIGMEDKMIAVGQADVYNVQLEAGIELEEFVVTALGISREKKSLGYATQEVSGDAISEVTTDNFVNNLSGKVAGVQIKQSGNIGGSTNVIIRGYNSLTGDNQALFVVDGIPMGNQNVNTTYQNRGGKGFDYGNAISDIDPDNIESINVLKGAAATALYGSRASNGVVMITTKKGKAMAGKKQIGVSINSGVTLGWADPKTFVEYQDQYGAGYGPFYDETGDFYYDQWYHLDINGDGNLDYVVPWTEDGSYGAQFDGSQVYHWDSFDPELPGYHKTRPWEMSPNDPFEFFETQTSWNNNVALYGGNENGTYRISYGNLSQDGILPNSELDRNNFGVTGTYNLSDKVKVSGSANYVNTQTTGRNSTGYSGNIMTMYRQWWQTNVDVKRLEDAYNLTGRNVTWNPVSPDNATPLFWDNPYWQRYENFTTDERNRVYGYLSASWELTDWVGLEARASVDQYNFLIEERLAIGSVANPFGVGLNDVGSGYGRKNINYYEYNLDLFARFNHDLTDKFNLTGILGTNVRRENYNQVNMNTSGGLVVPGIYSLSNSVNPTLEASENVYERGINAVFAQASLGYDRFLYLDATLRNDWASTLPVDNMSYMYPSVAASFIFSEKMDASWLDFGKVRLSYAEVGSDAPVHALQETYVAQVPFNSPIFSVPVRRPNPDLKPERSKSFEAGLNMDFFKGRVGFDFAFYTTKTIDGIIPVSLSRATGYSSAFVNAAEVKNNGLEIQLYGTPVRTDNFSWNIGVNWSKINSEVTKLYEDVQNIVLESFQGGITINATVGEPYGTIQGTEYVYLNGQRVVNPVTGYYERTSTTNNVLGTIIPDWNMGITNALKYKNWGMSFLIDWQQGGQVFSLDQWYGMATGLYPETVFTNERGAPVRSPLDENGGLLNPGVNPDGSVNETYANATTYVAFGYARNPNAGFVHDATYIKLREVALSWKMPSSILENTFLGGVTFSLVGSNLWIIDKDLKYADPEAGMSSGNLQGWQSGTLPTVRTVAFNVKLDF